MKKRKFHTNVFVNLVKNFEKKNPICSHFLKCGGCSFQDFFYEDQLKAKKKESAKIFENLVNKNFGNADIVSFKNAVEKIEIFGSEKKFEYRTRMDFVVNENDFGLRAKRSFDKVENLNECHIFGFDAFQIVKKIFKKSQELEISPYNLKTHKGFLRYISVRKNEKNELMIIFITKNDRNFDEKIKKLAELSLGVIPNETGTLQIQDPSTLKDSPFYRNDSLKVISVYQIENNELADTSFGKIVKFWGKENLEFDIKIQKSKYKSQNNVKFLIGPNTFFQQNISLFEKLLAKILSEIPNEKSILDLYCGVGTISLPVSKISKKIVGVESIAESIERAKENAKFNEIENTFFVCDTTDNFLKNSNEKFDILILDPPRIGLEKSAEKILKRDFEKIIYLSCNPITQAKDLETLSKKWKVQEITFWDLYPQTPHLESLIVLEK
ncbi:MAG: 23S rRNA (uracil(1939)-C(5))-methyltransferase RlmD [Patescibacteria group bacterium]